MIEQGCALNTVWRDKLLQSVALIRSGKLVPDDAYVFIVFGSSYLAISYPTLLVCFSYQSLYFLFVLSLEYSCFSFGILLFFHVLYYLKRATFFPNT